jgi:hypothetical protein
MSFPMSIGLHPGEEKLYTTTQRHPLGARGHSVDGRQYVYAQAAGTALNPGHVIAAAATVANNDLDLAVAAAAAVGATSVSVTTGATASVIDFYAEGYLIVNDNGTPTNEGEGFSYKIKRAGTGGEAHLADGGSTTMVVNLQEPIQEALTTANSQVGLTLNLHKDVVVAPAAVAGAPLGVAQSNIAADNFGWLQTKGLSLVLTDGTIVLGNEVMVSDNLAGAIEAQNYGGTVELKTVGVSHGVIGATTEYSPILLDL